MPIVNFLNVLTYIQPKANSVFVQLFLVFQHTEHLKEPILIFLGNTDACVDDLNHQYLLSITLVLGVHPDSDFALLREFEGIRLEPQEHLLDPHFIRANDGIVLSDSNKLSV